MTKENLIELLKSNESVSVKAFKLYSEIKGSDEDISSAILKYLTDIIGVMVLAIQAGQEEAVMSLYDSLKAKVLSFDSIDVREVPEPYKGNPDNVLVIPDLHAPYCDVDLIYQIREVQEKLDCGTVVFIGDIVDQYAWSRWGADPDHFDPTGEYNQTLKVLDLLYKMFPVAYLTIGNHDERSKKKASGEGLNRFFLKSFREIYNCPDTWKIGYEFEIDGVIYTHGTTGDATKVATQRGKSVVQGHYHTKCYVNWIANADSARFGMQVGTAIDLNSHAFAYGKYNTQQPVLSCGVVLDKGNQAMIWKFKQKAVDLSNEL